MILLLPLIMWAMTSLSHAHAQSDFKVKVTWVAHIKGGLHLATQLAATHDFTLVDQVEGFEDHYSLVPRRYSKRNGPNRNNNSIRQKIGEHPLVVWAEEQIAKERTKRRPLQHSDNGEHGELLYRKVGNTGADRSDGPSDIWESELEDWRPAHQSYGDRQSRGIFSYFMSRYWHVFNDSLWKNQWYLQDYRTNGDVPVLDLNVVPCYEEGITGRGVKIAILDDGLEWTHPDLKDNYEPEISTDFIDGDRDPMPRYGTESDNSHGTRCAGEIAMVANNSFCGVGVAYNAHVGGIKLLDGPTTDLVEGRALIYALDKVDIYSSSWGPPDNGMVVEAPGRMASKAFELGISKGRGGRGAIYVFAAGNGKSLGDSCAADGYINSVYTVAVASATQSGQPPYYGERCAAIITTAYSSGNRNEERIATTDIRGKCTTRHSGTSAAAPLAAGIIGLTLQANPDLTWRCVQHLIAWTSEVAVLGDDNDWQRNGAGFWVNTNFGFGLLNAHNMVQLARHFKQVPAKSICHLDQHTSDSTFEFSTTKKAKISFSSDGCLGTDSEINYLEHVQVIISLSYPFRGAVGILLESPSGTKTVLMETRPHDNSTAGLRAWTLTSVHQWGEAGDGLWTVKVGAKVMSDALDLVKADLKHSRDHLAGQHHRGSDLENNMNDIEGHVGQHHRGNDLQYNMNDFEGRVGDPHKYERERLAHDQHRGGDLDERQHRDIDLGYNLEISEGHMGDQKPRGLLANFRYGHSTLDSAQQHSDHGKVHLVDHEFSEGHVDDVKILLHGTREMPDHYKNGRRGYSTYRHQRGEDDGKEKEKEEEEEEEEERRVERMMM